MQYLYDTPGGHPEPSEVFENEAEMSSSVISPDSLANRIRAEIFLSILKEIRSVPVKNVSNKI